MKYFYFLNSAVYPAIFVAICLLSFPFNVHCVCPSKGNTPCATLCSSNQTCSTYSDTTLSRGAFQHPVSFFVLHRSNATQRKVNEIWKHYAFTNMVSFTSTECTPGLLYSNINNQPVFLKITETVKMKLFSP